MGNVLRRHRSAVDELESIVQQLQTVESRSQSLRRWRYNTMWWFTLLLLFSCSVYSALHCVDVTDHRQVYQRIALAWFSGLLVFVCVRYTAGRSFDFLLNRAERNAERLNTRRTEIIEDVKENEKFKVAKEIIERFGSVQDLAEIGVRAGGDRRPTPPSKKSSPPATEQQLTPPPPPEPPADPTRPDLQHQPPVPPVGTELALKTPMGPPRFAAGGLRTPMQRQPIRPFVQVSRTPIDKIIDYIIGDGPSNRYALICRQCHAHNGMALREEFDGMSFVCYNCGFYNPARNAQPLRTPRRLPALTEPESRPYIRTATNTDSSDNDDDRADNSSTPEIVNLPEEEPASIPTQ